MKKLSLNELNLEIDELLQREELKSVLGGYGNGDRIPCTVGSSTCTSPSYCIVDSYQSYPHGHCGYVN